jgi:type I restriction enzyme S subunit
MPVNIGDGRINASGIARITEADAVRLARHRLRAGDIVYSRRGDITRRALVRPEEEGWLCGTGCLLVRPGVGADPAWLSYWLGTPWVHDWLRAHAVGATMPNLNTGILSALPVEVPSLDEQKRIARVLSLFDGLIDINRALIGTLVDQADAVARAMQPAGEDLRFGDVCDVFGGSTPRSSEPSYWDGDLDWATPTDLTRLPSPYLFSTSRRITEAGLSSCSTELHPPGSILMTSRATIGVFALAQVPVATNQGFIVVEPRRTEDGFYLFHEMRRRVQDFKDRANGSTFLEISRGTFKSLPIRWPSGKDLRNLAARVAPLHQAAASLERETAVLESCRDQLLPLLLSGRAWVEGAAA